MFTSKGYILNPLNTEFLKLTRRALQRQFLVYKTRIKLNCLHFISRTYATVFSKMVKGLNQRPNNTLCY